MQIPKTDLYIFKIWIQFSDSVKQNISLNIFVIVDIFEIREVTYYGCCTNSEFREMIYGR